MPEKSILEELQASFPKNGKSDWIHVASTEVNNNDALQKLQWQIQEGINAQPYFDRSDAQPLEYRNNFNRKPQPGTFLGQRTWYNQPGVAVTDEKTSNSIAHTHLMNGGDGLLFHLEKKNIDFSALLEKIEWPFCSLSFVSKQESSILERIIDHCHAKGYRTAEIEGCLFWRGNFPALTGTPSEKFLGFRSFGLYIERSVPVSEIADSLAQSVKIVERLIQSGISKETAIRSIAFSVPVENNLLVEIAKLKTLRMLWFQITQAYQCEAFKPGDLHIHARSEAWVDERYQPHSNMLKGTVASIAAICGGCDSLTVQSENESNSLMQRMARNTSVLLREESHFNKVADPVAGSYAIEVMIDQLARESWKKFQSLVSK